MADVHSKETRSYNMSRIRGKNTSPELLVRKYLFSKGFRFRIHDKKLPGKPDVVLKKYRTVIFIHGCFWHGHEGCRYFVIPKTRTEWWTAKINGTVERDRLHRAALVRDGWKVINVWECELKDERREERLAQLVSEIKL